MYSLIIIAGAIASSGAILESLKNFPTTNCSEHEFLCGNHQCIPEEKRCDHHQDCVDNSDESNCEYVHCKAPDYFFCKNQRCIASAFVCDEEDDCEDFSDEVNCDSYKELIKKNTTCADDEFQCTDHLCIPNEWVCNGESDCLDGSDEILGCSKHMVCDGFKCNNGHCIVKEWQCDGQDDCRDNSDEIGCELKIDPKECTLDTEHFLCSDGKTCIKLSQVCDSTSQCPDKTDEGNLCKNKFNNCDHHNCTHTCKQFPTGPQCLCPKGYHNIDEKHCQDINECEIFGICDQACHNLAGSYKCSCEAGYMLQADGKTCHAHFGEPIMYFSSKSEIRAYEIKSEMYTSVAKNLKQVVGIDFDGQKVYWTDIFSEHESIVRSSPSGFDRELLVTSGLGTPEDLHVDFVTGNIYFTDSERRHVAVCTSDGAHCAVLVAHDVHKPRAIALHPREGELYWSDWGERPRIARALMDGSDAAAFVADVHWPNGLAIDYANERLYWTDAKLRTVESVRLDGTDRRVVLEGVVRHPYAIAVFENRLYWSDWATHSIQACDKFTGKNHRTIIKEKKDYIYGITIYHPALRVRSGLNPCLHAFCSDICLLKGKDSYSCACPQDKELGLDGHTCKMTSKKQRLVVGGGSLLVHVEHQLLGKHEVAALPTIVKDIGAMAYNSVNNTLYISDLATRKIVELDLHSGKAVPLDIGNLGQIVSMDFDYLGNNLYWCDSEHKTIEIYSLQTKSHKILIHDMHGETPESLALLPDAGTMFVSFQLAGRRESHVDRFRMDGTARTHPLDSGLLGPVSLAFDRTTARLFLADAASGRIESVSADGDERHAFRSLPTGPVALATLQRELFWVNERSRRLYWAEKLNSDHTYNKMITLDLPEEVAKLKLVSVTPGRVGSSACQRDNGGCAHFCLQTHARTVCACATGMALDSDNKTCTARLSCASHEFHCSNSNTCISASLRCDAVKNCPMGEDEVDCKAGTHCSAGSFQCGDGECIFEGRRCDGEFDCRDKSDEHNCTRVERERCPKGQFQCKDDMCISERFICDEFNDCLEGEDEVNCGAASCGEGQFRCSSGACIPKAWECDHDYDCIDLSDEHDNCPSCPTDMFMCTNGKCLSTVLVCDSEDDCGDNSDESSCLTPTATCALGEFACSIHADVCLPESARCNGTAECPHHEDEQGCSNCHVEEFACANKKCIPTEWICDRSNDCGDGSDEAHALCNHTLPSAGAGANDTCVGGFQCKTGRCLAVALVCDGEPNCYDGSDEGGLCSSACDRRNNPCGQGCRKTPSGPACHCRDGFQLKGDGHTCEDVNECEIQPALCSQICHNELGSHQCNCYDGFMLRADKKTCKAEGRAMSMLFTSDNQIREASQMENSLKLIYAEDIPKITGLDVDVALDEIYFTIKDSGTIHRINKQTKAREYIEQVGRPQKIALDWITKNIYMINDETNAKSITLCNFADKSCAPLIPIDIHRQISAIAVDPINKLFFFATISWWLFNSPSFVIYRSNLDGSGVQELVKSSGGYITGLAYDFDRRELFYVDQHKAQLSRIRYEGDRNVVLAGNLSRPMGLSFYENYVYFQSSAGYMGKCRLFAPNECDHFRLSTNTHDLFAISQSSKQRLAVNQCGNHTCSHLCVPVKESYKCLCANGELTKSSDSCQIQERDGDGGDRRPIYRKSSGSPETNVGAVIAGILVSLVALTIGVLGFYCLKKRNTGNFNISMRFQNPGYGLHVDETEKTILTPGLHEYCNPVDQYESDAESCIRKDALLVNV